MEYLNEQTIGELRGKLEKEKNRLEADLSSFAHEREDLPGDWETDYEDIGDDIDENAFEVEEYSNKRAVEHQLETRLKKVNDALARIERGTYGLCKHDQLPIPLERLRVSPETEYCQEHAE